MTRNKETKKERMNERMKVRTDRNDTKREREKTGRQKESQE